MPVTTVEDTPKSFEPQANLPITVTVIEAPMHGELAGGGAEWMYTPEANYSGDDAVTLLATANGDVIELAIPITVTAVNNAPLAVADSFATNADIAVAIDLGALARERLRRRRWGPDPDHRLQCRERRSGAVR